jgi:hypothetical protein
VSASLCIAVDKLAQLVAYAQNDPAKLAYLNNNITGDQLTELLAAYNNMHNLAEEAMKHRLDQEVRGIHISLKDAITAQKDFSHQQIQSLRQYADRSVSVRVALDLKDGQTSGSRMATADDPTNTTIP